MGRNCQKPALSVAKTGSPRTPVSPKTRCGDWLVGVFQGRLNNTQAMICIHLLDYWHHEDRRPFPSKRDLARRMGVTEKTIQTNISALEKAGIIRREYRKTASGDFNSNIYHLDGLINKVREIEPGFTAERQLRKENRSKLQSPGGLEKKPKSAE
ncbi:helix-turn-helix domain-containing protein [Xanthomonas hortorum]|uniref:helix-turn-helix domain-containing protein n=1 Tax=Xanthomonas hortorum TaxID=56454 RepID=UPI0021FCFBE0|nr:helix-turn-helix domain-containing protein [Xanthomonas hortorum]MDC8635654.1 helix-turn-helix domain-containing protein [Xanthomonas hortorum pv. pelargonii]UXN02216.1 helix-turn-helix domain-containing protein [Xanthomonas hortorum pv. pelargonii]WOB24441.1 helix-turn-helix domain-containing protein [Xanthomonas hortorum pv. pelargonii]WOB41706.1 helix-turn-helix domain-containing protein [Xanthomonas hortorum pv. pelargonii]